MKFKLAHDKRKSQQTDQEGTVVVKVFLAHKGHHPLKGNVIKTVRLENCRVSEVFNAIMDCIIEE